MIKIGDRKALARIVLTYAIAATGWILVSDLVVNETLDNSLAEYAAHSAKGIFFVCLTSILLYALVQRFLNERHAQDIEFAAVTEQAREGILICDEQLHVLYANQAMHDITGYALSETRGKPISHYLPPEFGDMVAGHAEQLRQVSFLRQDWQMQHKDGHKVYLDLITQRLIDGRYLAMGSDVSEIRSALRTAEIERQRLSALLNAIPDPVWLKNTDGCYIACNPAVEQTMNLPAAKIIGHDDETIHQSSDCDEFQTSDQHVIVSGKQSTFEQQLVLPDGSVSHFQTTKSPIFSAQGDLWGVVGIARDITRERIAITELKASERRFRTLFDNATDALLLSNAQGRFIDVNQRACSTYGYSREEMLHLSVFDITPSITKQLFIQSRARLAIEGNIAFRTRAHHRDGHLIPVDVRISKLSMDGQFFALAQVRDITNEVAVETQIRDAEELKTAIIDALPAQIAVTDNTGRIIQVNQAWQLFAHQNCRECDRDFCIINPNDGDNFFEVCHQVDGPEKNQAIDAMDGLRKVLAREIPRFTMESTCLTKDKERWFILNVSQLLLGKTGALLSYIDITHIKQAQVLQEKFRHQLQALARRHLDIQESERHLLSMELHDQVSQALAALKISLFNAQEREAGKASITEAISYATKAVDDIAETIHGIARRLRPPLLDQLGLTPAIRWHIDNQPALSDTEIFFESQIGNRRFLPEIELAAFRFVQEAVTNAVKHAEAGQIFVHVMLEGPLLRLEVKDDGIGFDVDHHERTNDQTSLGLLGIRERINQQNGHFFIHSHANAGTLLSAQLPIDTNCHESH